MKNERKNEEKDTRHLKTSTPQKSGTNQDRDLRQDRDLNEDRDMDRSSKQSDKKNVPGRDRA